MIERFLEKLIEELGANGLLIIGLYLLLYRPLNAMSRHIHQINHELHRILEIIDDELDKKEIDIGKD